jgi:hypothetical protein
MASLCQGFLAVVTALLVSDWLGASNGHPGWKHHAALALLMGVFIFVYEHLFKMFGRKPGAAKIPDPYTIAQVEMDIEHGMKSDGLKPADLRPHIYN